jgi:hypothetical protein
MERRSIRNSERVMCLECGCNQPEQSHGRDDVSTAVIVTPTETP